MIITCAFDDNYAYPGILSLLSAKNSLGDNLTRAYLGYDEKLLSAANLKLVSEVLAYSGLHVIHMPISIPPEWRSSGHISPMTFAKPIIADSLPDSHLWLDSDAFVLRDFTSELESPAPATLRMVPHWAMSKDGSESIVRPEDLAFYNAGVILWPEAQSGRPSWLNYVTEKGQINLLFGDQEVMNQVYYQDTTPMSGAFNANYSVANTAHLLDNPFVVHFPGSQKPWLVPKNARMACSRAGCGFVTFWTLEAAILSRLPRETRQSLEALRLNASKNVTLSSRLLYALPLIAKLSKAKEFFHPFCHQ